MFDTLTFAELDAQHVELLPTRTVLSLISMGTGGGKGHDNNGKAYGKGMSHSVSHTNIINSGNATAVSGPAHSGAANASGLNVNAAVPVNILGHSGDISQHAGNTAVSGPAHSGNATATGGDITAHSGTPTGNHSVTHTNIINSGNATATSGSATSGNATASGNNINAAVPVNIGGSSGDIHQSAGNTATSGAASSGNATATGGNITVK